MLCLIYDSEATPGSTQGLCMTLHSGITPAKVSEHKVCWGLVLELAKWPHAMQTSTPLCYHSSPNTQYFEL